MKKILVLISGSGTNLQVLIDAQREQKFSTDAQIIRVVSSSPTAFGLERAAKAHIPTSVFDLTGTYYKDIPKTDKAGRRAARSQFNKDLAAHIVAEAPDLIVCAGWMLILSPDFLEQIELHSIPIINLHPALPGQFAGIRAIDRAWEAGQRGEIQVAGVMIHKVIAAVDEGEPVVVKELDLRKDETLEEYEARVHAAEHVAILEGTNLMLTNL